LTPKQAILPLLLPLVAVGLWWVAQPTHNAEAPLTGAPSAQLPSFEFHDLEGHPRSSSEWQGKVLVVNFWATWCPPCREEMPHFVDAQEHYGDRGVQFVGIAVDNPDAVQDFVDVYGINFPILIGDTDAITLSEQMGNRFSSLPFTAIYDRSGKSDYVQVGAFSAEELTQRIEPLL